MSLNALDGSLQTCASGEQVFSKPSDCSGAKLHPHPQDLDVDASEALAAARGPTLHSLHSQSHTLNRSELNGFEYFVSTQKDIIPTTHEVIEHVAAGKTAEELIKQNRSVEKISVNPYCIVGENGLGFSDVDMAPCSAGDKSYAHSHTNVKSDMTHKNDDRSRVSDFLPAPSGRDGLCQLEYPHMEPVSEANPVSVLPKKVRNRVLERRGQATVREKREVEITATNLVLAPGHVDGLSPDMNLKLLGDIEASDRDMLKEGGVCHPQPVSEPKSSVGQFEVENPNDDIHNASNHKPLRKRSKHVGSVDRPSLISMKVQHQFGQVGNTHEEEAVETSNFNLSHTSPNGYGTPEVKASRSQGYDTPENSSGWMRSEMSKSKRIDSPVNCQYRGSNENINKNTNNKINNAGQSNVDEKTQTSPGTADTVREGESEEEYTFIEENIVEEVPEGIDTISIVDPNKSIAESMKTLFALNLTDAYIVNQLAHGQVESSDDHHGSRHSLTSSQLTKERILDADFIGEEGLHSDAVPRHVCDNAYSTSLDTLKSVFQKLYDKTVKDRIEHTLDIEKAIKLQGEVASILNKIEEMKSAKASASSSSKWNPEPKWDVASANVEVSEVAPKSDTQYVCKKSNVSKCNSPLNIARKSSFVEENSNLIEKLPRHGLFSEAPGLFPEAPDLMMGPFGIIDNMGPEQGIGIRKHEEKQHDINEEALPAPPPSVASAASDITDEGATSRIRLPRKGNQKRRRDARREKKKAEKVKEVPDPVEVEPKEYRLLNSLALEVSTPQRSMLDFSPDSLVSLSERSCSTRTDEPKVTTGFKAIVIEDAEPARERLHSFGDKISFSFNKTKIEASPGKIALDEEKMYAKEREAQLREQLLAQQRVAGRKLANKILKKPAELKHEEMTHETANKHEEVPPSKPEFNTEIRSQKGKRRLNRKRHRRTPPASKSCCLEQTECTTLTGDFNREVVDPDKHWVGASFDP